MMQFRLRFKQLLYRSNKAAMLIYGSVLLAIVMVGSIAHANIPPVSTLYCTMLGADCKPAQIGITNISKTPVDPELRGSQTTTTVGIYFDVTNGTATNVIIREILGPEFQFTNPPNFQASVPIVSINQSGPKRVDITLGNVPQGSHWVRFGVAISGTASEGNHSIDNAPGDPIGNCRDPYARAEFTDALGIPQCVNFPGGNIYRRYPKVIFNADAWIGNKPVQAGNTLQIGPNTLIISGQGTNSGISNYNLPTTGKLTWSNLESLMRQRVNRAIQTKTAQVVPSGKCPSGNVAALYLDSEGDSPFEVRNRTGKPKTWILNNCSFTLRNAVFYGTGTLINVSLNQSGNNRFNGGVLNIYQNLQPSTPTDTFGYISFRNSGGGPAGQVNVQGDADVSNMAIFTSGIVEMGGNGSDNPITREMQLVSRYLRFPPQNQMRSDIIFARPTQLFRNVPPFFQQFTQPSGREIP